MFVSFLSRYPSDTDNQIYSNSKIRIWNPILLALILCTASFQICLWISPCVHQCFAHYHLIAPWKISNLGDLSLASLVLKALSVWSSFLLSAKWRFWRISQKQFWITVFWICHNWSDYLLSSIQQPWVTYWLPYWSLFQEMLSVLPL